MPSSVAIIVLLVDISGGFGGFRNHFNGMTWALFITDGTAGTFVEVKAITLARAEFDDGLFRACPEATVTFKTVATAQAALCLIAGFLFGESCNHFIKTADGHPWNEV